MFKVLISGKILEVRRLNVSDKEDFVAVAVLKHWVNDKRGGYHQNWLVYLPKYCVAFAEIKQSKGFAVVVEADKIAAVPSDIQGLAHYEAKWCVLATGILDV